MATRIQLRRDTEANWTSANPTLSAGELAYSTDQNKIKIGNGSSSWTQLSYITDNSDEITEGSTNLFYTDERVDDRVAQLLTAGSNITLTYDDSANTLIISATEDNLSNNTTNDLAEGNTNLYFTTERAQDAVGEMVTGNTESGISVTYDDENGKLNFDVSDPVLTFTGDATGSGTITDLGNTSIELTVADNSHDHTSSNISDFTESVQDVVGGMVSTNTESGISVTYDDANGKLDFDVNDPTITLSGDVTGSGTITNLGNVTITATVVDDSHNHVISNVDGLQAALDDKAPLASPTLSGTPTAPTAASGTNTTQIATTAFVQSATASLVDSAPATLDTLNELAAALGDDPNFATTVSTALGNKQPLDADLTAIAALTGTSGFLKKTAADTWSLDTNTYLTGNQTITLTGDVSGSGTTSISVTVADDSHNHIISNVDGLQTALDAKLDSTSYTASDVLTKIKTVDGAASGLDSDLLDGQHGSYYLDWTNATNKPDPTITLGGDASGSLTLTDLSGGTLTVTIADDSHNHIIGNIDGLQTALDSKAPLASPTFTGTVSLPTTSVSGVITTTNYIDRVTGNGNSAWLQQDGTGRVHWYWNTYGGTSPTYTNAAEDAAAITMHTGDGGQIFFRSASGSGKSAGDPITWITTLYASINAFTYKGNKVWHQGLTGSPTAGGISYGDGTDFKFTSAGSAGQVLTSNGSSAPTWQTPSSGGFDAFLLAGM